MTQNRRAVALVPARGGSVGLSGKNTRKIGGKTLVERAIEQALKSGCFAKVVVSSDIQEVLTLAAHMGVEPMARPESLAGGDVEINRVAEHVVRALMTKGEEYDELCLLNPTSPLRLPDDIVKTREALYTTPRCFSSVTLVAINPVQMIFVRQGKRNTWHNKWDRPQLRQKRPPMYVQAGSVYWVKVPFLLEAHNLVSPRNGGYIVPKERAVDVDDYWDLLAAQAWYDEVQRIEGAAPA